MNTPLTHEQRVALYIDIINRKMLPKHPLSDFTVAYLRNAAPGKREMDALNDALKKLGWQK